MLKELLRKNRSYRGFNQGRPMTREELEELVDCARLCPSSVNAQPLCYYLVWKPEELALVQPLTHWAKALSQLTLPHPGKNPTGFIVICQNQQIDPSLARYQRDVGIVAQTMLLAAVEKGLGGCMIGNFQAGDLKAALHLPEHIAPMLVVALGEPAEQVVLTQVGPDGDTRYYRDDQDVHYVPKRKPEDLILNGKTE